jgi:hypothetical protein
LAARNGICSSVQKPQVTYKAKEREITAFLSFFEFLAEFGAPNDFS